MSGIFLSGCGAVSPAGWGQEKLLVALHSSELPASQTIERPGWTRPLTVRRVPAPNPRPAWAAHARMRRAAAISQFAMGAAAEALGSSTDGLLGIVYCTTCGCVNYSRRFYDEVLRDPMVASPLLFPETVFNAPASHLSAFLGSSAENYTVVGDATAFVHGLEIAAHWLTEGRVDGCLVVAAEELDWLTADAFRHFSRSVVCAEGAGALYLTSARTESTVVELDSVADGVPFTEHVSAEEAVRRAAASLASSHDEELLVDGLRGGTRLDQPEAAAWQDWPGPRLSPKRLFGEALTASAAWQCVVGCDAVASGRHPSSRVSVVGPNAQAIVARFKSSPTVS